jgi:hypothetical protein
VDARGERVLYLTTCESEAEIVEIARSHGRSLDGIALHNDDAGELRFEPSGIHIGKPLREFHGILTGIPRFAGKVLPHAQPNHERTDGGGTATA